MKPVAWINIEDGNSILDWEKDEFAQKHYPLYDNLISDLTDEEMLEVYKKLFNKKNEFKENLKRRSYFDFARAILQKARE